MVKDGAMGSTGAGTGVIYTKGDYGSFRLIFICATYPDSRITRPGEWERFRLKANSRRD